MRKFNVGDIFLVCDKGFDFDWIQEKDRYSQIVHMTHFFPENFLKYLEVTDKLKRGRKHIYKVRLFMENKKVTDTHWSSSRINNPQELDRWLPEKILEIKLRKGSIFNYSWAELAKEELIKEE